MWPNYPQVNKSIAQGVLLIIIQCIEQIHYLPAPLNPKPLSPLKLPLPPPPLSLPPTLFCK